MLSKEKIARINELSKKSRETGLSEEEAKEQTKLRSEYLQSFRNSMANTLEGVTIIDPEGNDVTPQKIKDIREKKKKLH
ncbi:DUF896 domain-containing protein [Bacillus sp. V5-8f]|uniref:DUF896 domain-containing protein n=1 Tax=Bacillus sp. V5-8f TaxID=2053044 RepID=UPI000C762844|nr:DUF896 domain-containing protein [Bacillus sp. V5-8f]PLT32103.1 hypothetical protein CUU64_21300 [Bacillus sp. V5-8f]